jgi:hypothetical protein
MKDPPEPKLRVKRHSGLRIWACISVGQTVKLFALEASGAKNGRTHRKVKSNLVEALQMGVFMTDLRVIHICATN